MSTGPRKRPRRAARHVRRNPLGGEKATVRNIRRLVRSLDRSYRYMTRIFHGESVLSVYDGPGGVYVVSGPNPRKPARYRSSYSATLVRVVERDGGIATETVLYPSTTDFARMVGAALARGDDPKTVDGLFGKTVAAAWRRGARKAILDAVVDDFAFHPAAGADGPEVEPYLFGEKNLLPASIRDALDHLFGSELKMVTDALRRDVGDWLASEDFSKQVRRRMKAPDAFAGYRENPRGARERRRR